MKTVSSRWKEPTKTIRSRARLKNESGNLRQDLDYTGEGQRYLQAYDENGRELLVNGTGLIPEHGPSGWSYTEVEEQQMRGSYAIAENSTDTIYGKVDIPAEYKGGIQQMARDIGKELKYPTSARKLGIQGKVFVSFVIDKNGAVSDVYVVRGISRDCNSEAARVVELLNNWKPGKHRGKVVKSRFIQPINFRLER